MLQRTFHRVYSPSSQTARSISAFLPPPSLTLHLAQVGLEVAVNGIGNSSGKVHDQPLVSTFSDESGHPVAVLCCVGPSSTNVKVTVKVII
jgi:hypothetical protein